MKMSILHGPEANKVEGIDVRSLTRRPRRPRQKGPLKVLLFYYEVILMLITTAVLIAGTVLIIFTDFKYKKVPNVIVFALLPIAWLNSWLYGGHQVLIESILTSVVIFTIFYYFYLKNLCGAGDVKYITVIGAWFGIWGSYYILLAATLLGVISILLKYLIQGNVKEYFCVLINGVKLKVLYKTKGDIGWGQMPENINENAARSVSFASLLGIAALCWQMIDYVV